MMIVNTSSGRQMFTGRQLDICIKEHGQKHLMSCLYMYINQASYRKLHFFFFYAKHMLRVLKRTVSMRQFF